MRLPCFAVFAMAVQVGTPALAADLSSFTGDKLMACAAAERMSPAFLGLGEKLLVARPELADDPEMQRSLETARSVVARATGAFEPAMRAQVSPEQIAEWEAQVAEYDADATPAGTDDKAVMAAQMGMMIFSGMYLRCLDDAGAK